MTAEVAGHLKKEAWIGGISNAIFNGVIAWLILRAGPDLEWGGAHSFTFDIVATAFLLPFIVATIVVPLQRSKLNKGDLQPMALPSGSALQSFADRFPYGVIQSALVFGLVGMLIFAPITLLGLYIAGVESFTPAAYAVFKGIWAGLLAALLVVIMVLVALRVRGAASGVP